MALFYETESSATRGGFNFNPSKCDATDQYLKHYANLLMLQFFAQHDPDPVKRGQANRELEICNRKLEYWRRQGNFSQDRAMKGIQDLKRKWGR